MAKDKCVNQLRNNAFIFYDLIHSKTAGLSGAT